ncbi:MAG: TonB family protein [Rhizobium sp.]|nr:MAG: TonB family protein [Rhizobium sp.]
MRAGREPRQPEKSESRVLPLLRWGLAAAVVLAVHGVGAWVALEWHPADAMPNGPPPAVMIDLAPVAVAPEAPPQDVAPGPQMVEAQPVEIPDTVDPIEPDTEPTPSPPTETQEAIEPDTTPVQPMEQADEVNPEPVAPLPEPEVKVPALPEKDNAEAVLAQMPTPAHKPQAKQKSPPKKHHVERKKPDNLDKAKQLFTSAPPTAQANRADTAAAPQSGVSDAPSMSQATWKGLVSARLNRYRRYPPGASGHGTAFVTFTMDRSGRVLTARLIGSSGDPTLDAEAVSLPKRASPLPAPPPGMAGGNSIPPTVPVRFDR